MKIDTFYRQSSPVICLYKMYKLKKLYPEYIYDIFSQYHMKYPILLSETGNRTLKQRKANIWDFQRVMKASRPEYIFSWANFKKYALRNDGFTITTYKRPETYKSGICGICGENC